MDRFHAFLDSTARWLVHDFGLLGLFIVAACDSSFLSLPEINDLLVVTMSINEPDRFWLFALVAALGSVTGCIALYTVGRKGGQAILRRKLSPQRIERLQTMFRRFDVLVVVVPSMLPPPCPFKVFVLSAGVFGMRFPRFAAAVLAGRAVRYLAEAWLAVRYGRQVTAYLKEYTLELALGALAVLLAFWLVRRLAARATQRDPFGGRS